jgi:hypothetical protein
MAREEWLALWENDEERYAAYTAASPEEKADMRQAYQDYIQRTYPLGSAAVTAAELES